jgi:hypothetical protein
VQNTQVHSNWDVLRTRNGVYPKAVITQVPNTPPQVQWMEELTSYERRTVSIFYHNNIYNSPVKDTPLERNYDAIAIDMELMSKHYPVYASSILSGIRNREYCFDNMSPGTGPWYNILANLSWNHASAISRKYNPRGHFSSHNRHSWYLKKNYTPAWNWEQINRMIVTEVISEYYVNWYYDYCKPCLETVKPVPGLFFSYRNVTGLHT